MADFTVSAKAYCKILLHVAKYPHCSVNGLLLAESSKSRDSKLHEIVDAVPLFHLALGLAPMLEVALTQVDSYCKRHNLSICGYYQANENLEDNMPNSIAYKVADRIHDHYSDACLLVVENDKLSVDCKEPAYKLFKFQDSKWKQQESRNTLAKDGLAVASTLLQNKAHRELCDFDNHLDDITQDWTNPSINALLQHFL